MTKPRAGEGRCPSPGPGRSRGKARRFLRLGAVNTIVLIVPMPRREQQRDGAAPGRPAGGGAGAGKPPPSDTRAAIVAAAERLFAERGLHGVSLVEIGQVAGQRNRSAVQYHFGDKAGLVEAIRRKHHASIDRRRTRRLDLLEARGEATLREFIEALVYPLAEEVLNADGGVAYVAFNASLVADPNFSPLARQSTEQATPARLLGHIVRTARELPRELVGPRMRLVTGMLFHGLADEARMAARGPTIDPARWDHFVRNLVDCIVAVLDAPASSDR